MGLLFVSDAQAQEVDALSDLERISSSSPAEMAEFAQSSVDEIGEGVKAISRMLEEARSRSNVEALQCLTNRLTSIRALEQVTKLSQKSLQGVLDSGDSERAHHEIRKVSVALNKARQLLAESERCADQDTLASGDSVVRWEGGIRGAPEREDTKSVTYDDFDIGQDPPKSSPFQ
jgi:hypothetical protein